MNAKKILVVGGAGFIGSQINKMLHQAGYDTVVFDNLSTGSREAVKVGKFIKGDLSDENALDALFEKHQFQGVMHFAGLIEVWESIVYPERYYKNNVVNTIKLLNAMCSHGVNNFIFSSTAAVYGIPDAKSIDENHPCNPINPYGQSKLMVEKILSDYDNAYGLKFCSLRYFNAAGGDPEGELKNYKKKESNLIPIILRRSLRKSAPSITIFGTDYPTSDGTCIRDYIHVYDLGTAHIKALEKLWAGARSNIFNLGNGHGFSVKEVIEAAQKITQIPLNVIEGMRRAGDPPILVANANKAKQELKWTPIYPELEIIIEHAWKAMEPVA